MPLSPATPFLAMSLHSGRASVLSQAGKSWFSNLGKPITCKQLPDPVLVPLLLGALVSRERPSGWWGHIAAASLREHAFTGETCSSFIHLAGRAFLVPRSPERRLRAGNWQEGQS